MVEYKVNVPITSSQFIALLQQTTLGERRPLDDKLRIKGMLYPSNFKMRVSARLKQAVGKAN